MTASPASDDDKVVLNNPKPVPRPGTWISAAIVTVLGAMLIMFTVNWPLLAVLTIVIAAGLLANLTLMYRLTGRVDAAITSAA